MDPEYKGIKRIGGTDNHSPSSHRTAYHRRAVVARYQCTPPSENITLCRNRLVSLPQTALHSTNPPLRVYNRAAIMIKTRKMYGEHPVQSQSVCWVYSEIYGDGIQHTLPSIHSICQTLTPPAVLFCMCMRNTPLSSNKNNNNNKKNKKKLVRKLHDPFRAWWPLCRCLPAVCSNANRTWTKKKQIYI